MCVYIIVLGQIINYNNKNIFIGYFRNFSFYYYKHIKNNEH